MSGLSRLTAIFILYILNSVHNQDETLTFVHIYQGIAREMSIFFHHRGITSYHNNRGAL